MVHEFLPGVVKNASVCSDDAAGPCPHRPCGVARQSATRRNRPGAARVASAEGQRQKEGVRHRTRQVGEQLRQHCRLARMRAPGALPYSRAPSLSLSLSRSLSFPSPSPSPSTLSLSGCAERSGFGICCFKRSFANRRSAKGCYSGRRLGSGQVLTTPFDNRFDKPTRWRVAVFDLGPACLQRAAEGHRYLDFRFPHKQPKLDRCPPKLGHRAGHVFRSNNSLAAFLRMLANAALLDVGDREIRVPAAFGGPPKRSGPRSSPFATGWAGQRAVR